MKAEVMSMSVPVNGVPIGMWTDEALKEELNRIVSTKGQVPSLVVVAEAAYRALVSRPMKAEE
jgi:hypothetical protein